MIKLHQNIKVLLWKNSIKERKISFRMGKNTCKPVCDKELALTSHRVPNPNSDAQDADSPKEGAPTPALTRVPSTGAEQDGAPGPPLHWGRQSTAGHSQGECGSFLQTQTYTYYTSRQSASDVCTQKKQRPRLTHTELCEH